MAAKQDPKTVVVVSPQGNEYDVSNPVSLYNLLGMGYALKGDQPVEEAAAAVAPTEEPESTPKRGK